MLKRTTKSHAASAPGEDVRTAEPRNETPAGPVGAMRARLTNAQSSVGNAPTWTSSKAAPVINRVRAYSATILTASAPIGAAVVAAWQKRRAGDPVIDESATGFGDWRSPRVPDHAGESN